jgi:hypothetical protein
MQIRSKRMGVTRPRGQYVSSFLIGLAVGVMGILECSNFLLAQSPSGQSQTAAPSEPKILIGPDMLVSRDGDIAHVETSVAANPRDLMNLVGAGITNTRPEGGWACKTYASIDGGETWTATSFPDQLRWGGADPQVAFGPHGTAYFTALAFVKDKNGATRGGLYFYRSKDGGMTWRKPTYLGSSYDHEVLAVDQTLGKYAGRIYLSTLYGYPIYRIGVFRSDNEGRTFTGPVEAANGGGKLGINTAGNILVLRDGTLFIPYIDFEFKPEKAKESHTSTAWFVTSADGGITFSTPHEIQTREFNPTDLRLTTFSAAAVDNQSDAFPDRIYVAWADSRLGSYRILFSYSSDRGNTWSSPTLVDGNVPASTKQYQPGIAINNQGVVGVTWFSTQNSNDGKEYDEYFTASVNGGSSFLPAQRVSSESSLPNGPGNLIPDPDVWKYKGGLRIILLSASNRWGNGGDYIGLTTDISGLFHPFWPDSRTGTFQIHTAGVRVEVPLKVTNAKDNRNREENTEIPSKGQSRKQTRMKADLLDSVQLIFDPGDYDVSTQTLKIPVRLKNISDQTIYGPVTLEVVGFGSGTGDELKEFVPEILNADNGKRGVGAIFKYSELLGYSMSLESGSVSGALVWKFKLLDPTKIPDLQLHVSGFVDSMK